ncbi:hypothetical protein Dsin_031242 [Dipteronia sinensis]|uniref:Transposase MuDR plant domain-containing protein n=1 Tax=Dipteronia sinensis TaxID=43782 RepID=A0AAD9ZL15_9ROSI|nr:hypothetical protein Dsin_031242 [Dipteronia sinensis]
MRENFEWKVKMSNKSVLHLVCKIDNCKWKLRVVRRDEDTYFQVRSYENKHSCPLKEVYRCHRQASAVIIGEVIAPRLQQHDGLLMLPKDIMTDMKTMFGIQVTYSKAHASLSYALALTYGSHEETIQHLPSFSYVLEQQNPGIIIELQCMEDNKFCISSWRWGLQSKVFGDRHASIEVGIANMEVGITNVFPYATHTICALHFYENIRKRFHRKDVAQIMFAAGK